jgi:hypothetical protein
MLAVVREHPRSAVLVGLPVNANAPVLSEADRGAILQCADAMLLDANEFFSFPYQTKGIERPWNYDPLARQHWPRRFYSERILHGHDTPKDVKIVWEINRFKDLPVLAEVAFLTHETKYADEVERRLLSWIDDNSIANSINWASGLELGIRLISWTASLELLRKSGFQTPENPKIQRSIWEHAAYLASDLSTDKVVRTNHLIGEVVGLLVTSILWDYLEAKHHEAIARAILEKEILLQTFQDGSTRESSTWYHKFVTDLCRIASAAASSAGRPMSENFQTHLGKMEGFAQAMHAPDKSLLRIGDADDGVALDLGNDEERSWERYIFGGDAPTPNSHPLYAEGGYATLRAGNAFAAMRVGPFGMGGDGFSSHAHDDLLSPVVYLEGLPILVDPGTFVYNGNPARRKSYRCAEAHNSIVIGESTGAIQKLNFGWNHARKSARLIEYDPEQAMLIAEFGEWAGQHTRRVELADKSLVITDLLHVPRERLHSRPILSWYLHFAPMWRQTGQDDRTSKFESGTHALTIRFDGPFDQMTGSIYSYSPSYLREEPAPLLVASAGTLDAEFRIVCTLT